MAVPDHTAPVCPIDRSGRIFPTTLSPGGKLRWRNSARKGKRRPPPPPEDLYALSVAALQTVLKDNSDFRLEPCIGERTLQGALPFDADVCYGLNTALYLLHHYVGRHGLGLGD